jgi:hypothetical protein
MMETKRYLTTGQIAATVGAPPWAVRRAIDGLGVAIPRAGQYRLLPAALLPAVEAALTKRLDGREVDDAR